MNRASDNPAPVSGFQPPTDGTAENGVTLSEQEEYGDFFAVFGENEPVSKPESEQCEFDFDAPSGSENILSTPAPEAELDSEDIAKADTEVAEEEETSNDLTVDIDVDAPLYGAEDDNAEGWREIDFSGIDLDTLTDASEGGTASGGGGSTPPPHNPNTTSGGEEAEPEHSRSTHGAPSTGLITLKSEHSEHSERSETFSSTDFDDPDWISPIYPESLWVFPLDIGDPYCEEFTGRGTIKITALNAGFCARLVVLWANLHMHNGKWFAYSECSGTWRCLKKAELLNIIQRCVMCLGEKYAIVEIVKLGSTRFCKDVVELMMPFPEYEDIFDHAPKNVINVKNGTIVVGKDGSIVLHEHSPEFLCRDVINIDYNANADYGDFVGKVFRDVVSPKDQEVLKSYAGQVSLGWNMSQTILIICGEAGTGKSIIVKVMEKVIGRRNWEGLRTSMLDQRFELSRFEGKSLLVASDQCSDALMKKGAHMLKSLTGDDDLTTERKGENEHPMISGNLNVIMVSNSDLPLSIDGDGGGMAS